MKFDQLIEYSMIYIFLKTSYTKCGKEASLRLFYEKPKLSIYQGQESMLQSLKVI